MVRHQRKSNDMDGLRAGVTADELLVLYQREPGLLKPTLKALLGVSTSPNPIPSPGHGHMKPRCVLSLEDSPNMLLFARSAPLLALHVRALLARLADDSYVPLRQHQHQHHHSSRPTKSPSHNNNNNNAHELVPAMASNNACIAFELTGNDAVDMTTLTQRVHDVASTSRVIEGRRVILLTNVCRLSRACQMALRKIIEQPTKTSLFMLTAQQTSGIESAILSRCLAINCNPVGKELKDDALRCLAMQSSPLSIECLCGPSAHDMEMFRTTTDLGGMLDDGRKHISSDVAAIVRASDGLVGVLGLLRRPDSCNANNAGGSDIHANNSCCAGLLGVLSQPSHRLSDSSFRRAVAAFFSQHAYPTCVANDAKTSISMPLFRVATSVPSCEVDTHRKLAAMCTFVEYLLKSSSLDTCDVLSAACDLDMALMALTKGRVCTGVTAIDARVLGLVMHRFFWAIRCAALRV
jgi:DNA polymerase III, delta subunit